MKKCAESCENMRNGAKSWDSRVKCKTTLVKMKKCAKTWISVLNDEKYMRICWKLWKLKFFWENVLEEKYMKCNSEQKNVKVAKLLNHSKAHKSVLKHMKVRKSVLKHAACVKACVSELKHTKMCNSTQKCAKSCKGAWKHTKVCKSK